MRISKSHNNNRLYNWIIYKNLDKLILKNSKLLKGNIYDLGCGNGIYKKYLLSKGNKYIGVDWSNTIHDSAADIVSDLNQKLNIESEVADTIISISVIEHLHNPQLFLEEAFRITKKGGNIIFQVPWQWGIHEEPHDYYRYTSYALKRMVEVVGFKNIVVEPMSGFFTTQVLKWNYFSLRFVKGPKWLKIFIKLCLIPLWSIGQFIAPILDKLDRKWEFETQGYFITAQKE